MAKQSPTPEPTGEDPHVSATFANDALNSLSAHIAVLDSRGVIIVVNEAWKRFVAENKGDDKTFYVGLNYLAVCEDAVGLSGDETIETLLKGIRAIMRGEQDTFLLEYPCHSPAEERWFTVRVTRFSREASANIVVAHENITARKRAEEELRRAKEAVEVANRELQEALAREKLAARTDDVTGVYNRRHFINLATHALSVAQRYQHSFAVILFDIDFFKGVNDTLGHQFGDEILKQVAQTARKHLREADVLARYGGDEFIISLPDSNAQQALVVAERIREDVAVHKLDTDKGSVGVTISIGIADVVPKDDTLDELIRRADQALYRAKGAGRNCTVV